MKESSKDSWEAGDVNPPLQPVKQKQSSFSAFLRATER